MSTCLVHQDKKKHWRILKSATRVALGLTPTRHDSESLVDYPMPLCWTDPALLGLPFAQQGFKTEVIDYFTGDFHAHDVVQLHNLISVLTQLIERTTRIR